MPLLPAAIAIIFDRDQTHILLVKRHDVPIWVLPGGGIEPQETAEQAVRREVLEETGYEITIVRKCAEYSPVNRLAAFTSVFICRVQSGSPTLSAETRAIAFHPLTQLPPLFFPLHAQWIEEAMSHPNLIQRPLTEVSYWRVLRYFLCHPLHTLCFAWTRWIKG